MQLTSKIFDRLAPYERRVCILLAAGSSNSAIAEALGLTMGTTKVYVSHVYEKFGLRHMPGINLRVKLVGILNGWDEHTDASSQCETTTSNGYRGTRARQIIQKEPRTSQNVPSAIT